MKKIFFVFLISAIGPTKMLLAAPSDAGMAFYNNGKYAEAAHAFELSLQQDTSRSQRRIIYLYMGKSYESLGRIDKAISAYETAADYDKDNWRRHRDLAGLYEKVDLYTKALGSYKEAKELNPKEASLDLAIGRVWRKIGIYAYAEQSLLIAKASKELFADLYEEFSYVYEGQGRFKEAAEAWAKTNDKGPRLIYLAALAGDPALITEGRSRLAKSGLSHETTQVYENLVQLLSLPPEGILAGKTANPALQALLKTQSPEGK